MIIYVEGPMTRDTALEAVHRAGADPPDTFVTERAVESTDSTAQSAEGRRASERSIVTVIRSLAATDPEFARLVARNDRDGDGIPDDNLAEIYAAVFDSEYAPLASQYPAEDRRSARVVYSVEADADPQKSPRTLEPSRTATATRPLRRAGLSGHLGPCLRVGHRQPRGRGPLNPGKGRFTAVRRAFRWSGRRPARRGTPRTGWAR